MSRRYDDPAERLDRDRQREADDLAQLDRDVRHSPAPGPAPVHDGPRVIGWAQYRHPLGAILRRPVYGGGEGGEAA